MYEDGQGYLTKFTADYEPNGSVRVVIADEDPGLGGNWIDSFAHASGVFSLRLIKTEGGPTVTLYQVPARQLREKGFACLDDATPIVSGQVTD